MTKQNNFIALRLSSELKKKLVEAAQQQNRTVSNLVKVILLKKLNGDELHD